MGSFSLTIAQQAYLERQASILSERLKRRVPPKEVLHTLLNLAIQDEGIYDPASPSARLISHARREMVQAEKVQRTANFGIDSLLGAILGDAVSPEGVNSGLSLPTNGQLTRSSESRLTEAGKLLSQLR